VQRQYNLSPEYKGNAIVGTVDQVFFPIFSCLLIIASIYTEFPNVFSCLWYAINKSINQLPPYKAHTLQ